MPNLIMSMLVVAVALGPDDEPTKVKAQSPEASATDPAVHAAGLSDGLWPSETLTSSLLTRWANRMSEEFELAPAESEKVRKATLQRWGRFLKENRADLQPLVNEFLEMRLGVEAPSEEAVRRWADRALPALEQIEAQAREATSEFREFIPPEKIAQFEKEAVQVGLGLQAATQKLKQWSDGFYQPHEVWQAPRHERQTTKPSLKQGLASAKDADGVEAKHNPDDEPSPQPEDQISIELTRWDQFVRDAIKQYHYDKAQTSAALSFLSELKGRAIAHRDRYKSEMVKLEQRIQNNSGSEEEITDIKSDLVTLYGPIDEMFAELKSRVEGVATTEQRIRAAEAKNDKAAHENGTTEE